MANLTESSTYEAGVYQLEITDAVIGGANGLSNLQAKQLANRTNWLHTNKQDKDATLTAIAALTTAADKLIYATGADLFSTTTLTAFARTLLDDADAATMRATIGAQVAGSYQASDATLTAIAALTTAADKLIYATGADLFSTTTLTAFARTLLDDADAATMRATIGAQAAGSYQASDATLTAIAALTTAADKLIYATGADLFSTTTLTAFARTLLDDADAATMRATIGAISSGDLMVAKAWVHFSAVPLYGTYSQTETTVTVTMTAHGMSTGMIVNLDFKSGTATDGTDFVVTVTGANTFTVVGKTSVTTSGNVTRNLYIRSALNVSSITDNGIGNYSANHTIGAVPNCAIVSTNGVVQNNSQANSLTGIEALTSTYVTVVGLAPYTDFSIVNIIIY